MDIISFLLARIVFIWSIFFIWPAGNYPQNVRINLYVVCFRSGRKAKLLNTFIPTSQSITCFGLFTVLLYLSHASACLTSWMKSEFYSYADLYVSYMFRKFPIISLSLVHVQNVLFYLYTCRVQPCIYGS